jgi:hypothetical protein
VGALATKDLVVDGPRGDEGEVRGAAREKPWDGRRRSWMVTRLARQDWTSAPE